MQCQKGLMRAVCFVLMSVILVASPGCAGRAGDVASPDATTSTAPAVTATAVDGTVFTGTYANDFMLHYQNATTDLARQILKDGQITSAEWAEMQNTYSTCVEGYGGKVEFNPTTGQLLQIEFDADDPRWNSSGNGDSASDTPPDMLCGTQTDFTMMSSLYDDVKRYPDGYDEDEYLRQTVECLVSHDLADDGMTVEEYKQIVGDSQRDAEVFGKYYETDRADYDANGAAQFQNCLSDPAS